MFPKHFLSSAFSKQQQQVGINENKNQNRKKMSLLIFPVSDSYQGKKPAIMRGEPNHTATQYFCKNQNTKGTKSLVFNCLRGGKHFLSGRKEESPHV